MIKFNPGIYDQVIKFSPGMYVQVEDIYPGDTISQVSFASYFFNMYRYHKDLKEQ